MGGNRPSGKVGTVELNQKACHDTLMRLKLMCSYVFTHLLWPEPEITLGLFVPIKALATLRPGRSCSDPNR
jgi:hypothetical protein